MAAITRRSWSAVEAEVIRRLGNIDAAGFSARVDAWIWQAYLWLALTYHHFELDETDLAQKVPTDTILLPLPDNLYILTAVVRRDATGGFMGSGLSTYDPSALLRDFRGQRAAPTRYARYGNKLVLNAIGDQAYPLEIYYYRFPDNIDLSSTIQVSELGADLDETIINLTLQLAFPAIGRPDLGEAAGAIASTYLAMQTRPPLLTEPLDVRERSQTNRSIGGAQG